MIWRRPWVSRAVSLPGGCPTEVVDVPWVRWKGFATAELVVSDFGEGQAADESPALVPESVLGIATVPSCTCLALGRSGKRTKTRSVSEDVSTKVESLMPPTGAAPKAKSTPEGRLTASVGRSEGDRSSADAMPALLLPAGATRLTRTVTDPDAGAGKAVAG